jgi:hypothetical protein
LRRIRTKIVAAQKSDFGHVYFIENVEHPFVKIGFARGWKQRLADLQTGNHCTLQILFLLPTIRMSETIIHNRLAHLRHGREWFRYEPEIDDIIEDLCNLSFLGERFVTAAEVSFVAKHLGQKISLPDDMTRYLENLHFVADRNAQRIMTMLPDDCEEEAEPEEVYTPQPGRPVL